jgi:hypothetical protein
MNPALQVEHWPAELLKAAVLDDSELPGDEAQALRQFIERIGGWENAMLAANMLVELENAWDDGAWNGNGWDDGLGGWLD